MSREKRTEYSGAINHAIQRRNNKKNIVPQTPNPFLFIEAVVNEMSKVLNEKGFDPGVGHPLLNNKRLSGNWDLFSIL